MKIWLFIYISVKIPSDLRLLITEEMIRFFVKQVTGPFVPSFAIRMYMSFQYDTLRVTKHGLANF